MRRHGSGPDVCLMYSVAAARVAAVFTTNRVKAAPVLVAQDHLRRSGNVAQAIVVNAGNANCATGAGGMRTARKVRAGRRETAGLAVGTGPGGLDRGHRRSARCRSDYRPVAGACPAAAPGGVPGCFPSHSDDRYAAESRRAEFRRRQAPRADSRHRQGRRDDLSTHGDDAGLSLYGCRHRAALSGWSVAPGLRRELQPHLGGRRYLDQ